MIVSYMNLPIYRMHKTRQVYCFGKALDLIIIIKDYACREIIRITCMIIGMIHVDQYDAVSPQIDYPLRADPFTSLFVILALVCHGD